MTRREQTRREFCGQACRAASLAALGGALGSALQGCGGGGGGVSGASNVPQLSTLTAAATTGGVALTIDSGSPLAAVGGAARVLSPRGTFLVARTAQDAFSAVTAICTHQACDVTGFQGQTYVCPCHGSEFDLAGRVIRGPASLPLRPFATQLTDNVLKISA